MLFAGRQLDRKETIVVGKASDTAKLAAAPEKE
jgi:hypothetical protein